MVLSLLSKAACPAHIARRVIPRQASRGVTRCSAAVGSSGNRRAFKFVGYGEQFQGDATTVCVDGLVKGADLQLTHWTGGSSRLELPDGMSQYVKTPPTDPSAPRGWMTGQAT